MLLSKVKIIDQVNHKDDTNPLEHKGTPCNNVHDLGVGGFQGWDVNSRIMCGLGNTNQIQVFPPCKCPPFSYLTAHHLTAHLFWSQIVTMFNLIHAKSPIPMLVRPPVHAPIPLTILPLSRWILLMWRSLVCSTPQEQPGRALGVVRWHKW